jgi:hypothetical protein
MRWRNNGTRYRLIVARREIDMSLDVQKDRLSKWRDGLWAFGAPLFFLLIAAGLGYRVWPVPLGVTNIATLLFTSLTVGGLLMDRWRADIDVRAVHAVDQIRQAVASRHSAAQAKRTLWERLWRAEEGGEPTPDELSTLREIDSLRANNVSVRSRIETVTYFLFMFAVFSGGFSIAGELRILIP